MTLVDHHNKVLDYTLGYELNLFNLHNELLMGGRRSISRSWCLNGSAVFLDFW